MIQITKSTNCKFFSLMTLFKFIVGRLQYDTSTEVFYNYVICILSPSNSFLYFLIWSHFDYKNLTWLHLNFFPKNVGFIIFVANNQITFHLYYFRALCIVAKPFRKIFATDLWKISTKKMSVKYSLNLNCWPKYFNNEMYFYIHSKRFFQRSTIYGFPK